MTSSPSSTRTPPSTSGSMTSCTATSRPSCRLSEVSQLVALLRGQRLGHPHGGHDPVLLRRGQGDEALDGVREGPLPGAHGALGQHHRGVGRPSCEQPAEQLLAVGPARSERLPSASRSSGLPSTVRANRKSSSSAFSRSPARSATISWARTAWRSSALAKVRPPDQRSVAASATRSTTAWPTFPSSSPCTRPLRADSGAPGSVTARRSEAEDSRASTTRTCRPQKASSGRAIVEQLVELAHPGLGGRAHGVFAGDSVDWPSRSARNRSTVRRARSSSSSDSPTIRLANVVASPPISLRSWAST